MTHVINLNYGINRDCIRAEEAESISCQSARNMLIKDE